MSTWSAPSFVRSRRESTSPIPRIFAWLMTGRAERQRRCQAVKPSLRSGEIYRQYKNVVGGQFFAVAANAGAACKSIDMQYNEAKWSWNPETSSSRHGKEKIDFIPGAAGLGRRKINTW